MRVLVHDFGGYSFPVQLSRTLAARGHEVTHAWCASLSTTPQADPMHRPGDPPTLTYAPVRLAEPLNKFSFLKRFQQEREYGRLSEALVRQLKPDVVLAADMPLDAQVAFQRGARAVGAGFVFWLQDVIGIAADLLLRKRIPGPGHLIGAWYKALEKRLIRQSDRVVLITEDFRPLMHAWGVPDHRAITIENWAPLEAFPLRPQINSWSERHGLAGKQCFVYAGTLGMKHNPELLLQLARSFKEDDQVRVVVVSQGLGADWLKSNRDPDLPNLIVLPFQDFADMPDVLGTASVLVSVLEPDAGVFSVPSKVLSYLCAGRAQLLAVPAENLAARLVRREEVGSTVSPADVAGFIEQAHTLIADAELRTRCGARARAYAEKAFDIESIADRFERVLKDAIQDSQR